MIAGLTPLGRRKRPKHQQNSIGTLSARSRHHANRSRRSTTFPSDAFFGRRDARSRRDREDPRKRWPAQLHASAHHRRQLARERGRIESTGTCTAKSRHGCRTFPSSAPSVRRRWRHGVRIGWRVGCATSGLRGCGIGPGKNRCGREPKNCARRGAFGGAATLAIRQGHRNRSARPAESTGPDDGSLPAFDRAPRWHARAGGTRRTHRILHRTSRVTSPQCDWPRHLAAQPWNRVHRRPRLAVAGAGCLSDFT